MGDTQSQLEKHEAECAIRYGYVQEKLNGLDKRLWRLEAMIMASTVAIVGAVIALITLVI
jgi:hypothetical protein